MSVDTLHAALRAKYRTSTDAMVVSQFDCNRRK